MKLYTEGQMIQIVIDYVEYLANVAERREESMPCGVWASKNVHKYKSETDLAQLEAFVDNVIGLYATDRPDRVIDPEGMLFEVTMLNVANKIARYRDNGG